MQAAFLICVTYPFLALFYEPNAHSLVAFLYIAGSCLPLLWAARYETEQPCDPIPSPSRLLFWSILLLGFFNLLIIAHRVGVSPWELLSVNGISSTAKLSTVARYEQGARSGDPLIQALSLFLIYRLGAADKKAPLWMAGLAYLPLVFYTLLTTEKWVMFLGIAFFFTGLFTGAPFRAALRRAIGYGLIFLPLGAALAGGAVVTRSGARLGDALATLIHYVLAPFPAFGGWVTGQSLWSCCGLGRLTFIGPLSALNVVERPPGVFTESVVIHGAETNIYTSWRYLASDYSLAGPFLILSVIAVAYVASVAFRLEPVRLSISSFVILSAFLSLAMTPFVHNSTTLAMVLCLGYTAASAIKSFIRPMLSESASAVADT